MKRKANPEHFNDLKLVLTLAEAAREYRICRKTLTIAIDKNNIAAVRQGRSVLISRRSLESYLFPLR